MRKTAAVVFFILAFLGASVALAASDGEYTISDLNMKVKVPEDWIVFTRDVAEDDPNLSLLGVDAESLKTIFKQNGVYLDAFQTEPFAEISVIMHNEAEIYDLRLLSDEEFENWIENDAPGRLGYTVNGYSVYDHKQARFITIYVQQDVNGTTAYGKQYFTIVNGQGISINMFSYTGEELTTAQETALESIMEGITFTEVKEKPSELIAYLVGGSALAMTLVVAAIVLHNRKKAKTANGGENL